jgi:hypothetical protein
MWRPGFPQWERICEAPELTWVYAAVVERASEDQELLAGREPSAVFTQAGLLGDGGGYFPDPTLKSGWLILDDRTQNFLHQRVQAQRAAAERGGGAHSGENKKGGQKVLAAALAALFIALSTLVGMALKMEGPAEIPATWDRDRVEAPPGDGALARLTLP